MHLNHITAPTKTNVSINTLLTWHFTFWFSFHGKKKNQRGRSFAQMTDHFLSCHAVKLCFHLGSHRLRLSIVLTEMETVKMTWTLWPTTVCKAETRPCESTQSFGKNMLPPSSSLTHLRFESSAVVQHLKVSWHILICLHITHPIQGTWGSHSKVLSLFSEVTQTWGQCTQFQKGEEGAGLGGLPKKFKHHTNICWDTVMAAGTYACGMFFSLHPLHFLPVSGFICARVSFGPPQRMLV